MTDDTNGDQTRRIKRAVKEAAEEQRKMAGSISDRKAEAPPKFPWWFQWVMPAIVAIIVSFGGSIVNMYIEFQTMKQDVASLNRMKAKHWAMYGWARNHINLLYAKHDQPAPPGPGGD